MELEQVPGVVGVASVVERLGTLDVATADEAVVRAGLSDARRLRCWVDGREVAMARRLAELTVVPEVAVGEASHLSERSAAKVLTRGKVADAVPVFGEALASGDVSGEHVDAIWRGLKGLEPARRAALIEQADALVEVAKRATPEVFERAVRAEVRRIEADGGEALLERQRRANRLKSWVDPEGMWCLSGRFDPETALRLSRRLGNAVATLFAEAVPRGCPDDPGEKQDFLRAHALAALLGGTVSGGGRPELIGVVDTTVAGTDGWPVVDWGLPVEVPWRVLADRAGDGEVLPVVIRNGVVLYAPGTLDLGRATRLANRAQRRALRALYPTCAIPGCAVRFDHCKPHHVIWWRHGGPTDLANLLPLCSRHHHAVHDDGWQLTLQPNRTLTIQFPDGTQRSTGPPRRQAA